MDSACIALKAQALGFTHAYVVHSSVEGGGCYLVLGTQCWYHPAYPTLLAWLTANVATAYDLVPTLG